MKRIAPVVAALAIATLLVSGCSTISSDFAPRTATPKSANGNLIASDGTVFVVSNSRCSAVITSRSHDAARALTLKISQSVNHPAVSPDGTRLAYITYPRCQTFHCTGICAGPAEYLPNVLAVYTFATGETVRTASDTPGHPLQNVSWSPDGKQLAIGYMGDRDAVLVTSAARPDFDAARQISPRSGCADGSPTWTSHGIVAIQFCKANELSPDAVVLLNSKSVADTQSWPLPSCIDGAGTAPSADHKSVVVTVYVGYGNGKCRGEQRTVVLELSNGELSQRSSTTSPDN